MSEMQANRNGQMSRNRKRVHSYLVLYLTSTTEEAGKGVDLKDKSKQVHA